MGSVNYKWIFRCYCRASNGSVGRDVINEWYQFQDEEVRAKLDATLEFFENRPNSEWRRPQFDTLREKKCQGLREIRIRAASGVYRILGFFGPTRQEFTLLIGYQKKNKTDTDHACEIAQQRKREVENDWTRARRCSFP